MTQHAIDRAKERYGLDLTPVDLKSISQKIKSGAAVLQSQKEDGAIWIVKWKDQVLRVFLSFTGFVVTVLPQTLAGSPHKPKYRKTGKQHEFRRVRDRQPNWREEIW